MKILCKCKGALKIEIKLICFNHHKLILLNKIMKAQKKNVLDN